MGESISKDYLLLAMDNQGLFIEEQHRIAFIVSCLAELLLKEIIYIENKKLYIKEQLSKKDSYLLPMYNTIKYSAAMKPKELVDYNSNELFKSVKDSLIKEEKTSEITEISIFGKDKKYIIAKEEEVIKLIENIKCLIENNMTLDDTNIVLVELLSKGHLIEKYFSLKEIRYLEKQYGKDSNGLAKPIYEGFMERIKHNNIMNFIQSILSGLSWF